MNSYFSLFDFFTNPILWPSTIGSMIMGFASGLVGVLVLVKRRALIGEALAHATYPGIVFFIGILSFLFSRHPSLFPLAILLGACITGFLGLRLIHYLEEKLSMNSDTALCFVLSTFLGFGVLIASYLQLSDPIWYQKIQGFLYGQAALLLKVHTLIYAVLAFLITTFIVLFFPVIKISHFDRDFSKVIGIPLKWIDFFSIILILLAIVVGIRSVGVILMAGMFIAPAAFAREFSKKLSTMFVLSSLCGALSAYLGNYFSVNLSLWLMNRAPDLKITLPSGPMILIVSFLFVLFALIFSFERGYLSKSLRRKNFELQCIRENILKYLYKEKKELTLKEILELQTLSLPWVAFILMRLKQEGLLERRGRRWILSLAGFKVAQRIVRLHRLWEVYLFTKLDLRLDEIHKSAEEMEHIITPEMEEKLEKLLGHPKVDPHNQIIPERQYE